MPNGINYFFVNQNKTYEIESKHGFLWAPKSQNKYIFHWENMQLVKKNDIILNYHHGKIKSYCIAKSCFYDCDLPEVMHDYKNNWEQKGRRIDCTYHQLDNPLNITDDDILNKILELQSPKYAPLNRAGNINQGYLFQINCDLACFLINQIRIKNGYIKL